MLYMLKEAEKKKKKSDGPVQHKSEFKRTNQFLSKCIWAEGKSNMMHPACIAVRQRIRWFGCLGGALLYLFRVGLLPLK